MSMIQPRDAGWGHGCSTGVLQGGSCMLLHPGSKQQLCDQLRVVKPQANHKASAACSLACPSFLHPRTFHPSYCSFSVTSFSFSQTYLQEKFGLSSATTAIENSVHCPLNSPSIYAGTVYSVGSLLGKRSWVSLLWQGLISECKSNTVHIHSQSLQMIFNGLWICGQT